MNEKIDLWFPTSIFVVDNLFDDITNQQISKKIIEISKKIESGGKNWISSSTYNTMGTFDLKECDYFEFLIKEVTSKVNKFANAYGTTNNYKCIQSWANISSKGSFQEFHVHKHCTFSAVYYSQSKKDSGNIVFENPYNDMLEITNIKDKYQLNYQACEYSPNQGRLLIFRSFIKHMVQVNNSDSSRISFAFNY